MPTNKPMWSWRRKEGIVGIKRFITQRGYDRQSPEMKSYYEPFQCASCSVHDNEIRNIKQQTTNKSNPDFTMDDVVQIVVLTDAMITALAEVVHDERVSNEVSQELASILIAARSIRSQIVQKMI